MAQSGAATGRASYDSNAVAALARFFPDATSMRMPVEFARLIENGHSPDFTESIVIEFGTPREVLFVCKTPLEFGEDLRLRNSDGSFDEKAHVVAVQYHPGKTLVAARFNRDVPNWIVKP